MIDILALVFGKLWPKKLLIYLRTKRLGIGDQLINLSVGLTETFCSPGPQAGFKVWDEKHVLQQVQGFSTVLSETNNALARRKGLTQTTQKDQISASGACPCSLRGNPGVSQNNPDMHAKQNRTQSHTMCDNEVKTHREPDRREKGNNG